MKFGAHLSESIQPEWSFNYISYDELKNVLKTRTDTQHWTETDEGYFVELLERELEKVYSFQNVKIGEVQRKLAFYDGQAQEFKRNGAEEETWRALEVELYRLIAEIDVLAKYTRLNYTGFLKIVKKHDVSFVRTSYYFHLISVPCPFLPFPSLCFCSIGLSLSLSLLFSFLASYYPPICSQNALASPIRFPWPWGGVHKSGYYSGGCYYYSGSFCLEFPFVDYVHCTYTDRRRESERGRLGTLPSLWPMCGSVYFFPPLPLHLSIPSHFFSLLTRSKPSRTKPGQTKRNKRKGFLFPGPVCLWSPFSIVVLNTRF